MLLLRRALVNAALRVAAKLRALGFEDRAVARAVGHIAWSGAALDDTWWAGPNHAEGALGAMVDAFVRGREANLRELLGDTWDDAVGLGLVEGDRSLWTLLPLGPDLAVCDRADRTGAPDGVFLPDSTTWAVRRGLGGWAGRHLDLGCGGGAIAVAAARSSAETVAIDINPRAITATTLSAALSGVVVATQVADITNLPPLGRFDRVSFVLPLLARRVGMGEAGLHTLANPGLLDAMLDALPRLLAPGGRAVLYLQEVLPLGPAIQSRFGARPVRAHYWTDWETETDRGCVRAGLLLVWADRPGGWTEASAPADLPGEDCWPVDALR